MIHSSLPCCVYPAEFCFEIVDISQNYEHYGVLTASYVSVYSTPKLQITVCNTTVVLDQVDVIARSRPHV